MTTLARTLEAELADDHELSENQRRILEGLLRLENTGGYSERREIEIKRRPRKKRANSYVGSAFDRIFDRAPKDPVVR